MSRNLKYRGFLITVAARGGVPADIAHKIVEIMRPKTDELDYGLETTSKGEPHLHTLCLWKKSVERSNLRATVQRIVTKFISLPDVKHGIDIRVVDDVDVVRKYISKETECEECFPQLVSYVEKNFSRAKEIIAKNAEYKANQIKYAYDNWDTWKAELKWSDPVSQIWASYRILIADHSGKTPSTRWKLETTFENMAYRAGKFDRQYFISDTPKKFLRLDELETFSE